MLVTWRVMVGKCGELSAKFARDSSRKVSRLSFHFVFHESEWFVFWNSFFYEFLSIVW